MQFQPNQTIFRGRVCAIHPETDGWGANVELEVVQNETSDANADADFLRPEPGSILTVFTAEPEKLTLGESFRVQASLRGDAFGERTVLEDILPLADHEKAPLPTKTGRKQPG